MLKHMEEATARRYPSFASTAGRAEMANCGSLSSAGTGWWRFSKVGVAISLCVERGRGLRTNGPLIGRAEEVKAPPSHYLVRRSASLGTSWLHIWMQRRLSPQGGVEADDPGVHAPPRARACGSVSIRVCVSVCACALTSVGWSRGSGIG